MISVVLLFLLILEVAVEGGTSKPTCDPGAKYRTIDGKCNNVDNEFWGAAGQPYERLVLAEYDDGSHTPRLKAISGNDLPNPRQISVHVHEGLERLAKDDTVMVMQWGQFLDHDMTLTPKMASAGKCCDGFVYGTLHSDTATQGPCFPIGIPKGDRYFKSCMEFKRSQSFMYSNPREQINIITGFIDASAVYGSSDAASAELRNGAYMKTKGDNLLPESKTFECQKKSKEWCFAAGDSRVNVFPGLSLLHTIFVREHNRIVNKLKKVLAAGTEDEVLFQEARKIISALIQQITYGEYLPLVLGTEAMNTYRLGLDEKYVYDPEINPTNFNMFATAALRFGHSAVPRSLRLRGRALPTFSAIIGGKDVNIEDMFKRNTEIMADLEGVVESLLYKNQEDADRFVTVGMTDHLFETPDESFDIVSLNIQRGRDHGLPAYNAFRTACDLSNVTSFSDSRSYAVFGRKNSKLLGTIYESPYDVDVFTGGLAEKHVAGGGVGPLFACLLGIQFKNVKFGDAFWYQISDPKKGFTEEQLGEIRKITLSKLLCDNTKINRVRKNSFVDKFSWFDFFSKFKQWRSYSCEKHPGIDFSYWSPR